MPSVNTAAPTFSTPTKESSLLPGLHRVARAIGRQDFHGRQRGVEGQHFHRTLLVVPQIRVRLYQGIRERQLSQAGLEGMD